MPNIITHTIFVDEVMESFGDEFKEYKQLYEIGANGPDFLFFYGINPSHIVKDNTVRELGSKIHASKINDFYSHAITCINKEMDGSIKKEMIAYVCGHLCHWALDCTVHPYVFYRTGSYSGPSSWWHHRFESVLDAIVLKVKRDITIHDFKASEICNVSKELARPICRIYTPIAREVYKENIMPHDIYNSLKDWEFCQKMLYDASGNKYKTFNRLERLIGKEHLLSGLFVPNNADDPFDTCNLMHKKWCHPCDDTIVSTDSFFDLYERAYFEACNVIRLFLGVLKGDNERADVLNYINNRTYDTGLNEKMDMKFFDLIY